MAILTDVPMDVLLFIVQLATPITNEFSDDFDDPCGNPFLVPTRKAPRSDCINYALVCRRLYHAAMPVLWEYIVIDTLPRLNAIANRIDHGFHHLHFQPSPRRLDLRLPAHYPISKVSRLIQYMSGLKVLVVANTGSSDGSSLVRKAFLHSLLRSTPALRRLQFMNDKESLSLRQFEEVGRSLRQLRTFQCFEIIPRRSAQSTSRHSCTFPKLVILSLGTSAGPPDGIHNELVRRVLRPGTLSQITRLDMLSIPSSLKTFLRTQGANLQHLTLCSDDPNLVTLHSLLSLCPKLETLTLVLGGWDYSSRWPKRNKSIRRINLVQPAPPFNGHIAIIPALRSMSCLDFPSLDMVYLHFDWDFYYDYDEARLQRSIGSRQLSFGRIEWPE